MKTYRGIELDIKNSTYRYNFLGHTFYFSSVFYMTKFNTLVDDYIENEQMKLYNKYHLKINAQLYLAISLYKKIEKRGFYIVDSLNNKEIKPTQEFLLYKL